MAAMLLFTGCAVNNKLHVMEDSVKGDFFVEGKLEVDDSVTFKDDAYFDGSVYYAYDPWCKINGLPEDYDGVWTIIDEFDNNPKMYIPCFFDSLIEHRDAELNCPDTNFIIAKDPTIDYGHEIQENPTIFIHPYSEWNEKTINEWVAIETNKDCDFVMSSGAKIEKAGAISYQDFLTSLSQAYQACLKDN